MNTYFLHNLPPPLPVLQSGTVQLFNGVADPSMGSTHHAWAFALLCCNLQKEPGEPGAHPFPLLLREPETHGNSSLPEARQACAGLCTACELKTEQDAATAVQFLGHFVLTKALSYVF